MANYTTASRAASRADCPLNSDRRHRAEFARQATIATFGWRHARALDQADFIDRLPVVCRSLPATGNHT